MSDKITITFDGLSATSPAGEQYDDKGLTVASSGPDGAGATTLTFEFDDKAIVAGMTLGNVENGAVVKIYDGAGRLLLSESFTSGHGESLEIDVEVPGAREMTIELAGSGSVDALSYYDAVAPDGIVNGTDEADLIDADYVDADGDVIDGGDARGVKGTVGDDDFVTAGDGNDTVFAGEGNDLVRGEGGADLLYGEAGMDTLTGGFGNDTAYGGDGMDEISMFVGDDVARGGDGNDWMWGGDGQDTLSGDSGDDMVNGEGGDDLLYGGAGDDTVDGGKGNDTIYGDSDPDTPEAGTPICGPRESFNWALADGFADRAAAEGFTQNTGTVDVTFSIEDLVGGGQERYETDLQATGDIDSGDETVDEDSSASTILNGVSSTATFAFAFSSQVKNVSFNVNDIDLSSVVEIRAFDADGEPVEVDLTAGSGLALDDDTASSLGGEVPDSDPDYSVNVSIPGVISSLEIVHSTADGARSGVNVTDMFFDPVTGFTMGAPLMTGGDDLLKGDDGDDLIYGEGGDDTIDGGAGDDTIEGNKGDDEIHGGTGDDRIDGGDGADTITGGEGDDIVTGGAGADMIDTGADKDFIAGATTGDMIDGGEAGHDYDVLDLTGSGVKKIDYTSDDREDGIITFDDHTTAKFEEIEKVIPCFTPGTLIATPRGEVPVEALTVGDRVVTRDGGIQTIRWAGRRDLTAAELAEAEAFCPVLIHQGALGHGLPERDMIVSPQHRVLMVGDESLLYFEEREVLVAAKHLVGRKGIERLGAQDVSYIHIMFDAHQIVLSDGAWTESFQPGAGSLAGLEDAQRDELLELFPALRDREGCEDYVAARRALKAREAALLRG